MEHAPTPDQPTLNFSSDNTAGAAPAVLDALVACAAGHAAPYGADPWTARVEQRLAELFEHEVAVFIVSTGTAANSLALAALTPPWGSVLCHPGSHINNDECGAPAFYADGAKLITVDGPAAKLDPARLRAAARAKLGDVHTTQPSAVSITQATEVAASTRSTRSARSARSAAKPICRCTWTARASPMRWYRWAARRPR